MAVVVSEAAPNLSLPISEEAGFTLLEILVAFGILAVLISLSTSFFMFNLRNNMDTEIRYEAMQAAQTVIDELRFQDVSTLTGVKNEDVVINSRTYAVQVHYCELNDFCISTDIRHVAADVTYKNKVIYETDTVFSKF